MGHLETGGVIFAPGFQIGVSPGVKWIPSPCELLNKGLPAEKGRVRSRCHRAGLATTRRHGRSEDHEKTRGVSGFEERPCHGKYFKLSSLSLCCSIIYFIYIYFLLLSLLTVTFPLQAIQATFKVEELVNITHRKMKDEESRRIVVVEAFNVVEKRVKELNTKLTEAEREKKSVEAALERAERQAETQRKQLHQAEDELATAKEQIKVLKKKLDNAEKARVKELNTNLTEAEREKKSVEVALEGAERQAETQRKQLHQAEDELTAAKEQIKVLKKKLDNAEKARDQAE